MASPRQSDRTCQIPSRDWTKPYSLATAGLRKMSGWYAGLTPSRLPGVTNPPRVPRPLLSDAVAEATPRTPRAAARESVMIALFPTMMISRSFAEAVVLFRVLTKRWGPDPCGYLSGTIHF